MNYIKRYCMQSVSKKNRKNKRAFYRFKRDLYNKAQLIFNIPYILKIIK